MFCEHIIILTDGRSSYSINIRKDVEVKAIPFNTAQSYLNKDCRLVELGSYSEIVQFSRDGFRLGFPADKSNWDFFAKDE